MNEINVPRLYIPYVLTFPCQTNPDPSSLGIKMYALSFQEPLSNRKKKLEDAQRYQEFLRDVEDEEAWIREKEPVVSSKNLGLYLYVSP